MRDMISDTGQNKITGSSSESRGSRDLPLMVIVAPSPDIDDRDSAQRAREYYRQYERFEQTIFFWGTPEEFTSELLKRFPMNDAVA